MSSDTALTESVEEHAPARFEPRVGDAAAHRSDAGGRAVSELRHLVDGLLTLQESDRTRIAVLLGDEVASVLTMARYLIEDAAQRAARGEFEEICEQLRNASARICDATQQLMALGSELRPRVLDDLGLLPALTWYFRHFSRDNRSIFVSPRITVAERVVPADLKLPLFRVVQAALSNVAKHSTASAARVSLSLFEDELRLVIEDDGVGFDAEHWRRRQGQGHCGLGTICRWVETSGGQCTIEATPRHGARVQAIWRLAPAEATAGSKVSARISVLGVAAGA